MPEFRYAKGRIMESLAFITKEINEFESDYSAKTWQDYADDSKLQKLIDRTIENILTSIIEVSGIILTESNISVESYADVMRKISNKFEFNEEEKDILTKFSIQRNYLAHRYLDFRWQVVKFYIQNKHILKKLITHFYKYEKSQANKVK